MQNEEWFLEQLEVEDLPAGELIAWIKQTAEEKDVDSVDSLAELLQETLQERKMGDEALQVLQIRAFLNRADSSFQKKCMQEALNALGYSPEHKAMVENVGFQGGTPIPICLQRLDRLRSFDREVLVYDKTWGAGVIAEVDYFYKKVIIDFARKKEHEMSFAYAAEALEVLPEGHLLSIQHKNPDRLRSMLQEDPAEVVLTVIRSFGPQPIQHVQEHLIPQIMPEGEWKSFWDKARKSLKANPLFDIPKKRNEPLRILETEKGYNQHWFEELHKNRNMQEIVALINELLTSKDKPELSEEYKQTIADRLSFVVRGARTSQPDVAVMAVLLALEVGVSEDVQRADEVLNKLLCEDAFLETVDAVPAKEIRRLLNHLCKVDKERTEQLLINLIPQLNSSVLNDAMALLTEQGKEEDVAAVVREWTKERQAAGVELLYWLFRNQEMLKTWYLGTRPDLARWMLRALNEVLTGEKLKVQNQLREVFEKQEWLESLIEDMGDADALEFMRRLKDSSAWEPITQRSIMARMIKLRPSLQEVVSDNKEQEESIASRVTSRRSYHERQEQLERIVTVEIPAVAKEIGIARAHGDLRENFEYKAAKDKQALLLRRRGEFEAMLSQVSPTDFDLVSCEQATQGTGVTLSYTDGRKEKYYILGEWDRDEQLGIISSESRLAQILLGYKSGDSLEVPTEDGNTAPCTISSVEPLSEEVRNWMNKGEES